MNPTTAESRGAATEIQTAAYVAASAAVSHVKTEKTISALCKPLLLSVQAASTKGVLRRV